MSTKRVLAAVSGGVDSSVAVHLLRQQGYEVEGVILEFSPAHRAAVESARVIAEQMKMPLHVIECHREFEENVILPFCRARQRSLGSRADGSFVPVLTLPPRMCPPF